MRWVSVRRMMILSIAIVAIGSAVDCRDATAPLPKHPIVGSYDLQAKLESYVFPLGTNGPYDTVSAGPAALSGTLTIADSVVHRDPAYLDLPVVRATITVVECTDSTCTAPAPSRVVTFTTDDAIGAGLTIADDTMAVTGHINNRPEAITFRSGRFAGDSIAGRLLWSPRLSPGAAFYTGTFVARRRG